MGLSLLCVLFSLLLPTQLFATNQSVAKSNNLSEFFKQASIEYHVPVEILLAIGYAETRWMDHKGKPSQLNGFGIMHLAENPTNQTLVEASKLLKVDKETLKKDMKQNIRGAAAVLKQLAKQNNKGVIPKNLADWYTTVASYSHLSNKLTQKWYADDVFNFINQGVKRVIHQEEIILPPTKVIPNRGDYENIVMPSATPDYPNARWVAASSSNYTSANRPADGNKINYVIIHTTQGSYAGAISWFQNPAAQVSAHYVIRSSDGQVTQMVQNKDIAWHAGNWTYNAQSIGIEHEGYVNDPAWYTDVMYRSSANLTRWLCDKYGIPKDRTRIIGHNQVPGATHTDPGTHWDWNYYMNLVKNNTGDPTGIIVDNETAGRFTASSNWDVSTYSSTRYGSNYRYATPQAVSDVAWYKINVPSAGSYDVYAWWPTAQYNPKTPYIIKTTTGNQTIYADQSKNGGKWNYLGTFQLSAGDYNVVGVSRWTGGSGYVVADAVKIVKK
ncbi:amidase [Thermoflavimicrobium daqui]|uniref:N-acetylmuramoyl-L-alanine amidase n=2 Tax=Thermoflavimicrobium daqui TaxID=2137476 RepID=A0A364K861_9BACL|nr:amidase [Thermoflavimicrobium daqui]